MAARPPASTASSASFDRSGAASITLRAAPAWITITLTLWVTTSCNSAAIRARSSSTALRMASSWACCSWANRSRLAASRRRQTRTSPASTPATSSTTAGLDQPGSTGSVSRNAKPASTAATHQSGHRPHPVAAVHDGAVGADDAGQHGDPGGVVADGQRRAHHDPERGQRIPPPGRERQRRQDDQGPRRRRRARSTTRTAGHGRSGRDRGPAPRSGRSVPVRCSLGRDAGRPVAGKPRRHDQRDTVSTTASTTSARTARRDSGAGSSLRPQRVTQLRDACRGGSSVSIGSLCGSPRPVRVRLRDQSPVPQAYFAGMTPRPGPPRGGPDVGAAADAPDEPPRSYLRWDRHTPPARATVRPWRP